MHDGKGADPALWTEMVGLTVIHIDLLLSGAPLQNAVLCSTEGDRQSRSDVGGKCQNILLPFLDLHFSLSTR